MYIRAIRGQKSARLGFASLAAALAGFASSAFAGPTPITDAQTTQIRYLSGQGFDDAVEWDFQVSDGRRAGEWTKIRVPSCWEQEGFGTYQFGMPFYGKPNPPGIAKEQGKYRVEFDAPKEWAGRRVRIVFEGSMTDTHVRVNGISTGPAHQGGFYRFRREITPLLKLGAKNQLEITVDKESANESVNLAERRADYWNFGGIFRPVFLEVLPVQFIERVALDARADGTFTAQVFLPDANSAQGTKVLAQVVNDEDANLGPILEAAPLAGTDRVELRGKFTAPKLWTAETPHLYRVHVSLVRDGKLLHTTTTQFGFRTFEVREGQGLFLNGQRILLKGVNRHSFRPKTGRTLNRSANYEDVRLIREMNMNAVRLSHYPADPEFLQACDELGLYVLNELGGWHGRYDTGAGRPLVASLVQRDVNHPSVIFWDNGNEGGWNTELDAEFGKWDPQQRPVLHPQKKLSGIDTMHYRSYGETQEFLRAPELFLPTEFLHGLYDGGIGAGLFDYWEMLRAHPRSGGGFLWALADEGLVRTDQNGKIDCAGNYAPDGIVGPNFEREASFYTVKEVWSPVVVSIVGTPQPGVLPGNFNGTLNVENRYDFTNLSACTFAWELVRFPRDGRSPAERVKLAGGELRGADIPPHAAGALHIAVPEDLRAADALFVTAKNPAGEVLWTSSWATRPSGFMEAAGKGSADRASSPVPASITDDANTAIITAGATEFRFDRSTGLLIRVSVGGKNISLSNGPRFIAARRGDRTLDGSVDREAAKGVDRVYNDISGEAKLLRFDAAIKDGNAVVTTSYFGALRYVRWTISATGTALLDYEYGYDGVVELMGVQFDYPESQMRSIRWLGRGPYRSWQNRTHGTTLGVWTNTYNDPIPGESWVYPEFKGYFHDWSWTEFATAEGTIRMRNRTQGSFLGVYTPRDGRTNELFTLPSTGLAVFDVVPALRNKVNATDLVGPGSQAQHVSGMRAGSVEFEFEAK